MSNEDFLKEFDWVWQADLIFVVPILTPVAVTADNSCSYCPPVELLQVTSATQFDCKSRLREGGAFSTGLYKDECLIVQDEDR